jgi:hypothetical protein
MRQHLIHSTAMFFVYAVDVVEAGCDLDYGVVGAAT